MPLPLSFENGPVSAVGAAHWAARGSSFCSRSYNLVGAALAAACPGGCFLIWTRGLLGPFAGGVRVTMAPSSAPFGGTFPLAGGRLCGRVLDPPLRRIWERPRCFCMDRSQTGPLGFVPGMLAGQRQAQERNRTSPNFCKPRAQWPGGNSDQPLRFCAPEMMHNLPGGHPPVMGSGERRL